MDYQKIALELFSQLRNNSKESLTELLNEFTRGEVGVLGYLAFDKNSVTAGELSEKLNVSTARIASILNSLENKGYIKRKEDKLDKRKTLVAITKKGEKLARNAKNDIIKKITKVIKEVGYEEIKKYIEIAMKIKKVLQEDEKC